MDRRPERTLSGMSRLISFPDAWLTQAMTMMRRHFATVGLRRAVWLALGCLSFAAQAQTGAMEPPIGMVKTTAGPAFVDLNGQRYAAALGMPVYLGSRLVTLNGGSLGVTFRDETVMSIGPDTQLVMDQYLFAPRQGQLSLVASLLRGTLNYVSGQIAKLRPEGVNVNTPTGMIGVRGTQFVARVDPL